MSARALGRIILGCAVGLSANAQAAPPGGGGDNNAVSYEPAPSVRRDGFAMALTTGFGVSQMGGFENEVSAISDPSERQSTGAELGSNFTVWFGGAIRDFLSVGLGIASTSTLTGNPAGANPAFILHVEGYPLFARGATWQDLGIAVEGGVGTGVLLDRNQDNSAPPLAEGGSMSMLGVSVFYEPIRFWQCSAGPSIAYVHSFSQSMNADHVLFGFRVSLYGVVPSKKVQGAALGGGPFSF